MRLTVRLSHNIFELPFSELTVNVKVVMLKTSVKLKPQVKVKAAEICAVLRLTTPIRVTFSAILKCSVTKPFNSVKACDFVSVTVQSLETFVSILSSLSVNLMM